MAVNLNDPRRADARGFGPMWAPGRAPRNDMVDLRAAGVVFVGGVHPALQDLLELLVAEDVARGYRYHATPQQQWGFAWRPIRGTEVYSGGRLVGGVPTNHSAGTAVDKNSAFNWLGRSDGGDIPRWMVDLWNRYGFRWGGDYQTRPDPMHYEFMGTRDDARVLTERAREELGGDELTPEEKAEFRRFKEFLDAVSEPLRPGKDEATAAGAGTRVARAVLASERDDRDPDGVEH